MRYSKAIAAACTLALAGCSGEPGASDMLAALNAHPKFQMTLAMLGGSAAGAEELRKRGTVEKSGCKEAQGAPGYMCDFRWGAKRDDGQVRYGNPTRARFFKSGGGWAVEM